MIKDEAVNIHLLNDWYGPLDTLISVLEALQTQYGQKAICTFDAGANNVEFIINPEY